MRELSGQALDSIFELINSNEFKRDIENIYSNESDDQEQVYVESIWPHKFRFYNDYVRVFLKVFINMHNKLTSFIYDIDVDYFGEEI